MKFMFFIFMIFLLANAYGQECKVEGLLGDSAIVNGKIYRINDSVCGGTLTAIKDDSIVVDSKEYTIGKVDATGFIMQKEPPKEEKEELTFFEKIKKIFSRKPVETKEPPKIEVKTNPEAYKYLDKAKNLYSKKDYNNAIRFAQYALPYVSLEEKEEIVQFIETCRESQAKAEKAKYKSSKTEKTKNYYGFGDAEMQRGINEGMMINQQKEQMMKDAYDPKKYMQY
ncbi:MAG: hypothetical protein JW867_08370 [Candidatus Omnitrophica bacterium]|nr:hypothetical protein [Candidatus Omnitrophota bacterium]